MPEGKIHIGTSGWNYSSWLGVFYPEKLTSKKYLQFYSEHFNTVEINASFYYLFGSKSYQNWYNQVPENFSFSVKVHRSITHIKRMKDVGQQWERFLEGAKSLREKLRVILFQFPSSFRYSDENRENIEKFLASEYEKCDTRIAFEFRHISWDNAEIANILKKHKAGWVIANSSRYPEIERITSDFAYFRMHGPRELFASEYSEQDIKKLAEKIKKLSKTKDIFVYFNNDFHGYAIKNALQLKGFFIAEGLTDNRFCVRYER